MGSYPCTPIEFGTSAGKGPFGEPRRRPFAGERPNGDCEQLGRSALDEAELCGSGYGAELGVDLQLLEDDLDVPADRRDRQVEGLRDGAVVAALCHQLQDLALAPGQAGRDPLQL